MVDKLQRRRLIGLGAGAWGAAISRLATGQPVQDVLRKTIPSSGEKLPVIGLGSWITFNVGDGALARRNCAAVVHHFFESGGRLIDCSPMYGSSQPVIGEALARLDVAKQACGTAA
jgi:hypothetical protein